MLWLPPPPPKGAFGTPIPRLRYFLRFHHSRLFASFSIFTASYLRTERSRVEVLGCLSQTCWEPGGLSRNRRLWSANNKADEGIPPVPVRTCLIAGPHTLGWARGIRPDQRSGGKSMAGRRNSCNPAQHVRRQTSPFSPPTNQGQARAPYSCTLSNSTIVWANRRRRWTQSAASQVPLHTTLTIH
jgi:hypothetical protein